MKLLKKLKMLEFFVIFIKKLKLIFSKKLTIKPALIAKM